MNKQYKSLQFPEIIVYEPYKYEDNRGLFFENFNVKSFTENVGVEFNMIQENTSLSKKNVIRGLHFQNSKFTQKKIISVLKGKILDVIVDIRPDSKNFGKWISYMLDDINNETIFIPSGFAHGFLSLHENTLISYKVDKPYNKNFECSIIWNDKDILVDWKCKNPILSIKDQRSLSFKENLKLNKFIF